MTTRRTVYLTGGIALAGAAVLLVAGAVRAREKAEARTAAEGRARRFEALSGRVREAQARRDRLKAESVRLRKAEADLKAKVDELPAPAKPAKGADGSLDEFATMMKNAGRMQVDETIATLKPRLGLTPDQEDRIRATMNEDLEQAARAMQNGDAQELSKYEDETWLASDRLADGLNGSQKAEYEKYRRERREKMTETLAAAEAAELGTHLELTPEQIKGVEKILKGDAELVRSLGNMTVGLGDPEAQMDRFRAGAQRLRSAVSAVLTAAQLPKLEEFLKDREEERRELIELVKVFTEAAAKSKE